MVGGWAGLGAWRSSGRLAFAIGILIAACALPGSTARAACDQSGSTVNCTGTTSTYDAGTQAGITITVQPGATVNGSGGTDAIRVQNPSAVSGDAIVNNGTIDGFVTILSSGFGIDSFTNNGVLKVTDPNSPLQSHSMFGSSFIQSASGTFMARVDANGFNDSILSVDATLAGRLVAVVQPGLYTTPITYTIISTFGAITGNFNSVTASSPFFTVAVTNCGCGLDLTLTPIAFNAVPGLTPNQKAVGDALQNLYATGAASTFFSNLFAATSVGVYDQLSGAGTTAAQDGSFSAGSQFNNTIMQQGLGWFTGASGGNSITVGAPLGYAAAKPENKPGYEAFAAIKPRATEPGRWRAWGAAFGATRNANGDSGTGSADQTTRTAGGAFGVDRQFDGDFLLGLAAGGSGSSFSVSSLSTTGRVDGGHVGLYAVKTFDAAYLAATLNYARYDNSTERSITGVGTSETAKGRFNSDLFGGRLELGRRYSLGRYVVTPFAAVEPMALRQQAYTESSTTSSGGNGVLGLSYASHTTTSLPTFVGAQVDARYVLGGGQVLSPAARLSWVHEFKPDRQIEASLVTLGSPSFTVDGARAARDALRTDIGATLALTQTTALFASFNGEFSGKSTMVAGTAGARLTW